MESLPVDAVEVLCRNLSVKDIVACSEVCRSWRELLNDNAIWQPHCSSRKQLVEHLRSTTCAVQPSFVSTHSPDNSLSSPCPLKVALMREKHLWNNIKRGNVKETPIPYDERKGSPYACGFLNDDLVYLMFKTTFEVWDVRTDPAMKFSEMSWKWTESEGKSFTVVGEENELAMISKGFMISVFKIDFQKGLLKLLHEFMFDGIEEKPFVKHDFDDPKHFVSGSLLIGVNSEVSSKIHVWDLKHGHRICEDEVGTPGFFVVDIIGSQSTSNVIIVSASEDHRKPESLGRSFPKNRQFIYMIYSLKQVAFLRFKDARITNVYSCAILKDFVAIWVKGSLQIYNYKTSELVFQGQGILTSYIFGNKLAAVGDYFIMSHNVTVMVYHPETKSGFVYPDTDDHNFIVAMDICFDEIEVIKALYHLGKSCIHISEDYKSYQLHQDRIDKIGVFNYISFIFSGTRSISCISDVTKLHSLMEALTAMDPSKLKKPGGSHGKTKQLVIRQFW